MRNAPTTALLLFLLAACGDEAEDVRLPGDDTVLAEVGETKITKWDLDRGIERTLSEAAASQLDAEGRRKMLETLVSSRAIALASEAEMTPEQKEELEREVAIQREQLLVRRYLDAHTTPAPVSAANVQAYYDAHPERFGGGTVRTYEMVFTTRTLADSERALLLTRLAAAQSGDLSALANELSAAGLPVAHQAGEATSAVLHDRLKQVLSGLALNQTSPVTFVDGRAFVLRATGEQRRAPRPLAEVSAEIRQTLAPTQLRDSIQTVRRRVLSSTRVRYRP